MDFDYPAPVLALRQRLEAFMLRWLRDRIGPDWLEEHRKLTQYELGDSPAVALTRIWWRRDSQLEMTRPDAAAPAQGFTISRR